MESVDLSLDDTASTAQARVTPGNQIQNPADQDNVDVEPRPDWLPEKFTSSQQMAEAYQQLERRMSQQSEPLEENAGIADLQAVSKSVTSETLAKYSEEFVSNGQLSDESYADLSKQGVDKSAVDMYIAGQQALVTQNLNTVYQEVGGQQEYAQLIEWATRNLPETEINTFNEQVQAQRPDGSLDMDRAMFAIKGLKAQQQGAEGRSPQLLQGGQGAAEGNAFKSTAQVVAAMQDPLYESDPAFRQDVQDRLAISNIF